MLARAPDSEATSKPKYHVAIPAAGNGTLMWRTVEILYPWTVNTYPGRIKGFLSVLTESRSITWAAVQHWYRGRRSVPSWAARAMATHLRQQGELALQTAAAWEEYAAEVDARPKRLAGICAVDPETGRDHRGNWRR
jgi:hypothetical protein